jgi:4-amino-4-deoxy-L-arabinose transferase-like glycosyltransferase
MAHDSSRLEQADIIAPLASRKELAALGVILLAALALRLCYLLPLALDPGFDWPDPDHYLMNAKILTANGWEWTFRAVRYEWAGRYFYLPPLYPLFLSLFSVFPKMAAAAQLGQMALGVAAVALVYEMGRLVHSGTAGLLAAAVYALWFPSLITSWFYQETLYVPLLLLAFVLYLRAARPAAFGLAGAAFGLAALTRSMPLYFLPFLLGLELARKRPRAALALALGFVAAVLPYSIILSIHLGEVTVIENHGGIILLAQDPRAEEGADLAATTESLVRSATRGGLRRFTDGLYGSVRSVLHVNGGRLLQSYVVASSESLALAWKMAAHLFGDLPFVLSTLLAPFGLLLARRKDASLLAVLWIVLNLALVSLGGFAGPRLRSPFEPHLMVLGSVAVVSGFRGLGRSRALAAGGISFALLALLAPQVPRSLEGWPDYGIRWQHRPRGWRTEVRGSGGFNFLARTGAVPIEVRARPDAADPGGVEVALSIGRREVERTTLAPGEVLTREFPWPERTLAFVEVNAKGASSGKRREVLVITSRAR